MKIIFNSSEPLRKLFYIYQLFGPPDAIANGMRPYSQFFGTNFYIASKISSELPKESNAWNNFWSAFLYDKESAHASPVIANVRELLENLEIPIVVDEKFFEVIEYDITLAHRMHEDALSILIKKIFGFDLPNELMIILTESGVADRCGGGAVTDNPWIIGLELPYPYNKKFDLTALSIVYHELLHLLIRKNILIKNKTQHDANMLESIIQFFTPDGVLDKNLGIIKEIDFDSLYKRHLGSYYKDEWRSIFPILKEYYKVHKDTPIWDFLNKNGLEYIIKD